MNDTGTVYILTDPRDGVARYVGSTWRPLAQRLRGHLSSPFGTAAGPWIQRLLNEGRKPEIHAVATVPVAELRGAECAEICRRALAGEPLLNVAKNPLTYRLLEESTSDTATD